MRIHEQPRQVYGLFGGLWRQADGANISDAVPEGLGLLRNQKGSRRRDRRGPGFAALEWDQSEGPV